MFTAITAADELIPVDTTDSRSNTTTELVVADFWPAIDEKTIDE